MTTPAKSDPSAALRRTAIDMGPLIVFFGTYFVTDLFTATGAYIVATVGALGFAYHIEKRIPVMPLVTGVIVIVFGGLTLVLNNKQFIMMKPTIVNVLFASVLLLGLATGRPMLKFLFNEMLVLTDKGWTVLTVRWAGFFLFLALLNELVWRNFAEGIWVTFKVAGVLPLTLVFATLQLPLLKKHAPAQDEGPLAVREE